MLTKVSIIDASYAISTEREWIPTFVRMTRVRKRRSTTVVAPPYHFA